MPPPSKMDTQTFAHRLLTFGDDAACTKFFDERTDVDFNLPNEQGCTLLVTACAFDRSTLLPNLIHRTSNVAAATHSNANNVLHFAALSNHPDVMRVVLETDMVKMAPLINLGNANGDTPLMVACTGKYMEGVDALLAHGADISPVNQSLVTALMCAARTDEDQAASSSAALVGRLLAHGGDVCLDAANVSGNTALHMAVQSHNCKTIQVLLDAGCDVSVRNADGRTALDVARSMQNVDGTMLEQLEHAWRALEAAIDARSRELLGDDDCLHTMPSSSASTKKKKTKKKSKASTTKTAVNIEHTPANDSDKPDAICLDKLSNKHADHLSAAASPHLDTTEDAPFSGPPPGLSRVVAAPEGTTEGALAIGISCAVCATATKAMHAEFPLFEDMDLHVVNFVLGDLDGLSMSQLEVLQEAHMKAFQLVADKKVQVARRLEAERVQAEYELEQQILNLR
ncbi:Aste57867_20962 [Aphanomyces stellatus]|uniref:Aste57867_20962 protein n=1 Tax=Aphanomyces stellatus TaxID=120398 RepID=A0A485LGG2_9STRA|nr:hypothetical protein As57867_020894 [Aphanomyces stellatus]VFT97638.1 Aste57867_20962 [Aphanomyces stellatus]